MKARLVAIGERSPNWVDAGLREYQKRLSGWLPLELVEIAPGIRGKGRDPRRASTDEGRRALAALSSKPWHIVALEGSGQQWSSERLAERMLQWRNTGCDLALMIGGPEGHSNEVLAKANEYWSLGAATLPHMLVRLIVAEQLYRACTILAKHPYHRS